MAPNPADLLYFYPRHPLFFYSTTNSFHSLNNMAIKRTFDDYDDEPVSAATSAKSIKLDLPQQTPIPQPSIQPRILPFRASPTSQHTLSFASCSRTRPVTLISASGALTPESSDDESQPRFFLPKPADLNLQTPPQSKSSKRSSFQSYRDVTDMDVDMAESPAASPFAWKSPVYSSTPRRKHAREGAEASTPPSPTSCVEPVTPSRPRPLRFALQPAPRRDQIIGGRIPTPTYGHFQLDPEEEISPMTRQRGSFIRRGACPPSPISEDECESSAAIANGLLDKLNIGSPTAVKKRNFESPLGAKLGRIMESEAFGRRGGICA